MTAGQVDALLGRDVAVKALRPELREGGAPAEVRDALVRLGLVPRLAYDGSGHPVGTVSDVEPAGQLAAGSGVVLHVVSASAAVVPAAGQPAAPAKGDRGKGEK